MSLKHTLLGLLILHPRTGYDLHKRMEGVTFLLESASLRRIYPTLKQMAEEELVTYQVEIDQTADQAQQEKRRKPVKTDAPRFTEQISANRQQGKHEHTDQTYPPEKTTAAFQRKPFRWNTRLVDTCCRILQGA